MLRVVLGRLEHTVVEESDVALLQIMSIFGVLCIRDQGVIMMGRLDYGFGPFV